MERRATKIVAIILLVCMFPLVLAIPLAIFVHPSFLLLLLVLAFAIPFLRAVRRTEMGKAADWLREERRKVLGDWVAVCLRCGAAQRYFEESEDELPAACTACGGELRARCPACDARFSSAFAVECERAARALRPEQQFGIPIRKSS